MASADPGWELYRTFLAAMREGSLSGAARSLDLTQPTVGRHLDQLEGALGGVPLFLRSQKGLQPTEAALALVPHAETMASAARALIRAASGEAEEARGTVRVTASEVVGAEVLPAIFTSLRERHPRITVELLLSNRNEDLLRRDADLAVRTVRPAHTALVSRRLGDIRLGMFAHRRYEGAHGLPSTLAELGDHALIGFDRETASVRRVRALGVSLDRATFAYRCDSDLAQLAMIRAGFGIGICQRGIALRNPDLVPVLPDAFRFELPVWVVMHEDLRASRRMRLMFDHLAEGLLGYLTEGRGGDKPARGARV
jgi:DNA-binding transcriptional LysR family regulator